MIQVKNVTKIYEKRIAVNDLSFNVKSGEVFGLIGTNGAGKTTTIKIILGLTTVTSGEIVLPKNIKIGYSPETPHMHPFLSAADTLKFYGKLQKIPSSELKAEIDRVLQIVGLEKTKVKISKFSKGMLQRLAFAQALLGDPELIILDEPCAGLDPLGRMEMIKLIETLKKSGKTIIFNSHILSDVERVADRVLIIHQGEKVRFLDLKENTLEDYEGLEDIFVKDVLMKQV